MKRIAGALLTLLLALLLMMTASAEMTERMYFDLYGTPSGKAANVYSKASDKSTKLGKISSGEMCAVDGTEGNYYRIDFGGQTGYVSKSKVSLTPVKADTAPEADCELIDVGLTDYMARSAHTDYLVMTGTIRTKEPVDTLYVYIYDVWQDKPLTCITKVLPSAVTEIRLDDYPKMIKIAGWTGGRRKLVLQGSCAGGKQVPLYQTTFYVSGRTAEAANMTKLCKLSRASKALLDTSVTSGWTPSAKAPDLRIDLPGTPVAELLTLEWDKAPGSFTVELIGADGETLSKEERATGFLLDTVHLTPDVSAVVIVPGTTKCRIVSVRVYEAGYCEDLVQDWQPLPEKVDLMLFVAHEDDEEIFFGGLLPYYAAEGKTVAMMYCTDGGRDRYQEALTGLWVMGHKYHPIFLGYRDKAVASKEVCRNMWHGEECVTSIVRQLRRYKPDVIVSHDFNGEYVHTHHKMCADLTVEAAEKAADPSYDPESVEMYGTWQVKKVYIHLYGEEDTRTYMDWNQPLFDDITPLRLAIAGFDRHRSQQGYFTVERFGTLFDCSAYGLYASTVGEDVEKNDLFEHIE